MKTVLPILSLLLLATAAEAASIAPHRGVYDLTLLRASEGASLQSASGKLAFEIDGSACDGYTVTFRMATRYRRGDGETTLIDTTSTTFENGAATELRHQSKESVNGRLKDSERIKITRETPQAEGKGEIRGKPDQSFTVPAGAALPTQHQLKLMALGEAGGGRDSSVVYDGSDGGNSYRAISFVGPGRPPGGEVRAAAGGPAALLMGLTAWPTSVSYYALDSKSETPDYQVSFDMYENGVATGLVLDYGDFALAGTLTDLKLLDKPNCP